MVRIVEAEEEEDVAVGAEAQTEAPNYSSQSPHLSPLSSHHLHHHYNPSPLPSSLPPSSAPQPSSPPPDSPNSISSISSGHIYHGFSPSPSSPPATPPSQLPVPPPSLIPVVAKANRLIRDQPEALTKSEPDAETGIAGEVFGGGAGDVGGGGIGRTRRRQVGVLRRARTEKIVKRLGLGLRVCEFVVCLVSFSVMAADKNRGWALDSFDRYLEFRYSMSINILGFAYSGLQGLDLLLQLTTGKNLSRSQLRYYFDFAMDQILAYLLLSASSSAFTRVDEWISNWGQDKFPGMASASVGVSFLAFAAYALSSLISGYILCTNRFT